MKKITFLLVLAILAGPTCMNAQNEMKKNKKSPKITLEEIEEQCKGISVDERVTMSVSSFSVATRSAYNQFGDELSQMLTNALQNVNCFNILLSIKDSGEIMEEIDFGESGNVKSGTAAQRGNMKGAQVVVVGKVTEFAVGDNGSEVLGIGIKSKRAHVGFVVQLVNPETREIIDSESFNVDGKAGGLSGLSVLGINVAGGISKNKALSDACEKGIIQAVEYIVSNRDKMPLPDLNAVNSKKGCYITLNNADYNNFKTLVDLLSSEGEILEKNISQGTANFFLAHEGTTYDIADKVDTALREIGFSIESVSDESLTINIQ